MRAMRARLILKLTGVVVMLVLTVVTAHSCSSGSSSSPLDPATLEHNGLSGMCADQSAAAAASGDETPQTLQVPAAQPGLPNLAQAAGLSRGTVTCPTTTVTGGP